MFGIFDVRSGSNSEVDARIGEFCFAPINGHSRSGLAGPISARSRHCAAGQPQSAARFIGSEMLG